MEKKKLKLDELNVESFVTKLNEKEGQTIDGGTATPACIVLPGVISLVTGSLLFGSCTCNKEGFACRPLPNPLPAIRSDNGCSGAQWTCPTDPRIQSKYNCYTEQVKCVAGIGGDDGGVVGT